MGNIQICDLPIENQTGQLSKFTLLLYSYAFVLYIFKDYQPIKSGHEKYFKICIFLIFLRIFGSVQ